MGHSLRKPDGKQSARDSAAPRNGLKGKDIQEGGPAGAKEGATNSWGSEKVVDIQRNRLTSPPPPKYGEKVEDTKFPLPPGSLPPSVGMPDEWEEPEVHSRPTRPSDSPEEVSREQDLLEQMRETGELAPPPAPTVELTRNYRSSLSLTDEQTAKLWEEYHRLNPQKKGGD